MIKYAMQCGDAMAIAYKLVALSLLLKSFSSFNCFLWPLMRNARTKIAMMYMREHNLAHEMICVCMHAMVAMRLGITKVHK
jgi:hypothetical protein